METAYKKIVNEAPEYLFISAHIINMMKTYVTITFSSEGSKPSEVERRLFGIGLQAIQGRYDFVYEWERDPSMSDVMDLLDRIQEVLRGTEVFFSIETL
ncbi:MAG: hypothetical protein DRN07_01140 [Thermoplasmata archaeon]|nr:MAG: hypothetical protein DRN07_01140 [Thermoplasmata archaeon]